MEKYKIAIIKPNKYKFNGEGIEELDEEIGKLIDETTEIKEVTMESMMKVVVEAIGLTPNVMGDTKICYETDKYVYQMCHKEELSEGEKTEENINGIASYLTTTKNEIYGKVVLISSKITETGVCSPETLEKGMIRKILYEKLIHKGVIVYPKGMVEEFRYIKDPIEGTQEPKENLRWTEIPILNFNLIAVIELNPKEAEINEVVTRISGKEKIMGKVMIVSKTTEVEYVDLDKELLKKIDKIAYGRIHKRRLSQEEKRNGEKIEGRPIVRNRYCILEKRIEEYENEQEKCENCGEEFKEEGKICKGCYRVKYHNKECQKEDWLNHKNECVIEKETLNEKLKKNYKLNI